MTDQLHLQTSLRNAIEQEYSKCLVHVANERDFIRENPDSIHVLLPGDIIAKFFFTLIVAAFNTTTRQHQLFSLSYNHVKQGKKVSLKQDNPNMTRIMVRLSKPSGVFEWPLARPTFQWPGCQPIPDTLTIDAMEKYMALSIQATAEWSLYGLIKTPTPEHTKDMLTVYNIPMVTLGDMLFARLVLPYSRQSDSIGSTLTKAMKPIPAPLTSFSWNDTGNWKGLHAWAAAGVFMGNAFMNHYKTSYSGMTCEEALTKHGATPMFDSLHETSALFKWTTNASCASLPWGSLVEQMRLDYGRFFIGMSPTGKKSERPFNMDMFKPANEWIQTIQTISRSGNNTQNNILTWGRLADRMSCFTRQSTVCRSIINDITKKLEQQALAKKFDFRSSNAGNAQWEAPKADKRQERYNDMRIPDIETFLRRYVSGPHVPPCLKTLFQHAQQEHHLCDFDRLTLQSVVTHLLPGHSQSSLEMAKSILGYGQGGPIGSKAIVDELKGHLDYSYRHPEHPTPSCEKLIQQSHQSSQADPLKTNPKVSVIRCPFANDGGDTKSACVNCMRQTGPAKNATVYRPTDRLLHLHETGQLDW